MNRALVLNAENLLKRIDPEDRALVYQVLLEIGTQLPTGSMVTLLDLKELTADWPESLREAYEQISSKKEEVWQLGIYIRTPQLEISSVQTGSHFATLLLELRQAATKAVFQMHQNLMDSSGQRDYQISELAYNPSKYRLH